MTSVEQTPQRWQSTPELPLRPAPFLRWPIDLAATLRYLVVSWSPFHPRLLMFVTSIVVWFWLSPSAATAATLQFDWIALVWLRNTVIVLVVAGGAHLWLYRWKKQGDDLRYDARPLAKGKRIFLFRDQVLDNMALTLGPAVLVWTAAEVLLLWARANGFGLATGSVGPVWTVALIVVIPWWSLLVFSIGHRLLHLGPAYRRVHSWHHKNVNVGPWSGLAMHPVEHVVLFSDVLLLLVVPWHPVHLYFMLLHHGMGAPLSHTGFDAVKLPGGAKFHVGDFHHQLHHRFLDCNYGGLESPLDPLLDVFHDGTPQADAALRQRRQRNR